MLQEPSIDVTLRALAEPRRREILGLLQAGEMTSGAVASHFDVTRPAISQHLRVLQDAGLLDVRKEGARRMYHVRSAGMEELRASLSDFWEGGLARLKVVAENAGQAPDTGTGTGREHAR